MISQNRFHFNVLSAAILQKALLNFWKGNIWCFTIFIFKSIHLEHSVTNWGNLKGRNLEVEQVVIVKKSERNEINILHR